VRLSDRTIAQDYKADGNYLELNGAYLESLRRSVSAIKEASHLSFSTKVDLNGQCALIYSAHDDLISYFFELKRDMTNLVGSDSDWPRIKDEDFGEPSGNKDKSETSEGEKKGPSQDELRIEVRYSLIRKDDPIVLLTITLRRGQSMVDRHRHKVIIDPSLLEGCKPQYKKQARKLTLLERLTLGAKKNKLRFTVKAVQARLQVKKDPVQIDIHVDEPLHMFCWYVDADETAFVLYPSSTEAARKPWKAGTKKQYPIDFGFQDQVFQEASKLLFGCYASPKALPETVEKKWINAHPLHRQKGKNGQINPLTKSEVEGLVAEMGGVNKVEGAFVWLEGVEQKGH
ncbi:MAG: hypothetical protein ACR2OX_07080, partial [Methyloligellaceae bacterium]